MQTATILQSTTPDDLKALISQAISEQLDKLPAPPSVETKYLSRKEVCKELHITLPTLNYYTKSGIIKGFKFGRRILYKQPDITEALKQIQSIKYRRGQ